jgi:acetyltransferase-like isoleucine patch superfamily enzyme
MKLIISKLLSFIKSEKWELDHRIPNSYLILFFFSKILMLMKGFLIFFTFKHLILIGVNSKLYCKSLIKFGGTIHIDRNCIINALSSEGIVFGRNVSIGKFTTIECSGSLKNIGKGLIVGKNVGMGTHGFFGCAGGVTIGNDTIFGNYVSLHSENHIIDNLEIPIRLQGVTRQGIIIGNNCWIGAKVTILDGANIGDGCIVAAGAVVTKGCYESNSIIGGVPAKIIKKRN